MLQMYLRIACLHLSDLKQQIGFYQTFTV